jgi:hypothetical protein
MKKHFEAFNKSFMYKDVLKNKPVKEMNINQRNSLNFAKRKA